MVVERFLKVNFPCLFKKEYYLTIMLFSVEESFENIPKDIEENKNPP